MYKSGECMYRIICTLIFPNGAIKDIIFKGFTEEAVIEKANRLSKTVAKDNPLIQINFKLQGQVWQDLPLTERAVHFILLD